jgi:hypothetical protein
MNDIEKQEYTHTFELAAIPPFILRITSSYILGPVLLMLPAQSASSDGNVRAATATPIATKARREKAVGERVELRLGVRLP